jgi:ATP-dependent Lhr-like helicase
LKAFVETPGPRAEDLAQPVDPVAQEIVLRYRQGSHFGILRRQSAGRSFSRPAHAIAALEKWRVDPYVLHHGSISKDLRQKTELSLKENEPVTAICTGTLELGIDLGNVQSVCQVGPTWSVASLVQIVGRSDRKEDQSQVLRLFTLDRGINAHSPVSERLNPELIRAIA